MKISIFDFKGIDRLENYNFEAVNVLTGANSGGKSSLIHFLLLLKQSMDTKSSVSPLKLNHPYVTLGKFEQIVRKFSATQGFGFKLTLSRAELDPRLRRLKAQKKRMVAPDVSDATVDEIHGLEIEIRFKKPTDKVVVDFFKLKLLAKAESTFELRRNQRGGRYKLSMSEPDLFLLAPARRNEIVLTSSQEILAQVTFASFFPLYLETEATFFDTSFPMDLVRFSIQRTLNKITYIGPLREEPKDFYFQDDDLIDTIGNKGENAAYLLAKCADHEIAYKTFDILPDGRVMPRQVQGSVMDALNYWMCDVFKLAKKVRVSRAKSNRYLHSITLLNNHGQDVPITHVGFGVSQIFPILVEGLRPKNKRIIILEQPEIHLHPRVQSWLFDFVTSAPDGVSFVIETHSDHFVNRLRRRIAEDETNTLKEKINLTFVRPTETGVEYQRLTLSEIGTVDYWPDGFFDQYDDDMEALVRAQARRKRKGGSANAK